MSMVDDPVRRCAGGTEKWEPCVTSDGRVIGWAEWVRGRAGDCWSRRRSQNRGLVFPAVRTVYLDLHNFRNRE